MPERRDIDLADQLRRAQDRIVELEEMVRTQHEMLQDLATAAGFHLGETFSAQSLIARLRIQGR